MNRIPAETEKYAALLKDEKALLDEFLSFTHEQAELLAKEDIDGFNASLTKRRSLIEKIDALIPKLKAFDNSGANADIGKLRRAIGETLQKIEKISNSNREALMALMTGLSDEIKKQGENQKMLDGYSQIMPSVSSEYFDRRF